MTRIAMVGYGRIAPQHLAVFRALDCEVVASCNRSEEGRRRAAEQGGIPRTYASVEDMVEREQPQGIVCCPSFDQVYGVVRSLLPFRIPLLVEKPAGTSLAEAEELVALAAKHESPVMVAFNRRHYSVLRKALEDAGGRSQVTAVSVEWSEDPNDFMTRRGFTQKQASLCVFGNTTHGLDLITYLGGSIPNPTVIGQSLSDPLGWQMAFQGVSDQGVLANFTSNWVAPARWRLTFSAPGRRYLFAPLESCSVLEYGSRTERTIEPDEEDQRFKAGFYAQAQQFLEVIRTGEAPEEHSLGSTIPTMRLAELLTNACQDAQSKRLSASGNIA